MKKAFITGITGQDGSYLTEFLIGKGYEVHGLVRRSSSINTHRIEHIFKEIRHKDDRLKLHYGDLSDSSSLCKLMSQIKPDEVYHLGAQSHVRVSFDTPEYTADITGLGTLRVLEAIRNAKIKTKFYQASSSEMFGLSQKKSQNENTPFYPKSPYGCAKVFAYWITRNYRESYDMFACNGILFNHESPRRGNSFVTKKITRGLVRIKLGLDQTLSLGNLDAKRDWGYAKDYVEGMWLMLQQSKPDDYVLASGESHSVRDFVKETAKLLGFDLVWKGKGVKEEGIDRKTGKTLIKIDPYFFRPSEIDFHLGDCSKARRELGWKPKTSFKKLVKIMVEADLEQESLLIKKSSKKR